MHRSTAPSQRENSASCFSRRRFLALASASAGATILAACGGETAPTPTAAPPQAAATRPATQAPIAAGATPATTGAAPAATVAMSGAFAPTATVSAMSSPTISAPTTSPTISPMTGAAAGKPGGIKNYKVALLGDLTQLDPALINSQVDFQVAEAIYNYIGRYTYNPPLGNAITPELADWEVQDGAKTYLFHLKKGVMFHRNYGELTAADVKANWERLKDPKTASPYRTDFTGSTIDVIDPYTLKVSFDRPYPSFISASLAFRPGLVISPRAYMEIGDQWKTKPVGTGPFLFDTYLAGSSLTLKRNGDYWGTKPKVDQITYKFKVDDKAAVLAVAKGELDAYYLSDPDIAASVAKNPDPNTKFYKSAFGQSPMTIWFNMKKKPLDDIRVRHALRYTIDNNAIAKNLFGGLADPIQSFLPPFMFGFSDDITRFDYNPDMARQLLKEANVSPDWAPSFLTLSNLVIDRRVLEAVASFWTDVGIKVKAEALDQGVINQRTNAGDYDMYATYVARIEPDQLATPYWSSGSSSNRSYYSGADDLIARAKSEPDPALRAKLYRDLQDKISQDSPATFVVAVSESLLVNKRVIGIAGAGWQERHDWFSVDVPAE